MGAKMPKMAPELSGIEVKRLKHPGGPRNALVAVGGVSGLYMQLLPGGGKTWILVVRQFEIFGWRGL